MKKIYLFIFLCGITFCAYSQNIDEKAIKELLQKEAATWRSGDIKSHADCWAIRPYSRIIFSNIEGNAIDVPLETIINPPANMVGEGGVAILSNFKMNIYGNQAWVSHDEESIAKDGTKSYTYEFRMLEKINHQWKIVAQSIHAYKPK